MARQPFDINRVTVEGKAAALLPTLGARHDPGMPMAAFSHIDSVDAYVASLHMAMGDIASRTDEITKQVSAGILEACKALGVIPPQAFSYSSMSFLPDPANYGLMQWPGINPESLRKVARENISPAVIIRQRSADMARYSGLSSHFYQPGWRITMREASETPTTQDREDIKRAERFVYNCSMDGGADARERDAHLISPFEMFLRGFADDTLTFDGWAVWTDMKQGKVNAFANLPAGMIRLAMPTRGYKGNENYFAALVDETGTPVKPLTRDELTWRVRNVRNDPSVAGYGWPEVEILVRIIQAFQGGVELNAGQFVNNCYSSDTEVLTKDGWRTFDQVEAGKEEFATLNLDTGEFEYQKATHVFWSDYEGDMFSLSTRSMDLMVTPNHRIITQYRPSWIMRRDTRYTVYEASDLFDKFEGMSPNSHRSYCLPTTSTWKGAEIGEQSFPHLPPQYGENLTRNMSGDDYCAFMGMYLSEGNVSTQSSGKRHRVMIHQRSYSKGFEPFKKLLTRILGREPGYTGNWFYVDWHGLAEHVEQFGRDCYSKIIPPAILNATPRQQQIFWDYYVYGDGHKHPDRGECIGTTSKLMADQLQELAQKMGFAASITKVDAQKYNSRIDGRAIFATCPRYDVRLKQSVMQSFNMVKGAYVGKVGCVSVPNGTLYVRRNGKAAWCGNSIPNGMLLLKGDYFNQDQVDALMREWTNMKRGMSKLWGMPVMAVPEDGAVELIQFMDMKGRDMMFRDHMNMMMGLCCLVWCFPIRRLGMFVSGHNRDNQPTQDAAIEIQGADDPGLPPLLQFVEDTVNPYLLWPRWPRLKFGFMAKNPKEDARQTEARKLARTWGEARAEADLPKLSKIAPTHLKPLAEIMEMAPEDAVKAGTFQTVAVKMLEAQLGTGDGKDPTNPGAPMQTKKDPAEAQGHGHLAGVRRNSRQEKDRAAAKQPSA